MTIISKKIDGELLYVACGLFEKWYVLYRLSRHVILKFGVMILGKLKKRIFQEYYSTPPTPSSSLSSSDDVELSSWSSTKYFLPQEIMELILQRLPLNDYLRLSTVCQTWRFIVAKVIAEKRCNPAPELPLLMFCAHPYTNMNNCFLRLNDKSNINYKLNCPELHWRNFLGSIEGWLIMSDGIKWRPEGFIHDFWFKKVKNFFFNPVSGAQIMLPSQTTIRVSNIYRHDPLFFSKVVASAVPTSPNCFVVAICRLYDNKLAFCRPTDSSWTLYEDDEQWFIDVVFHDNGKLYAITKRAWRSIMVFDLWESSQGCTNPSIVKVLEILPAPPPLEGGFNVEGHTIFFNDYPAFYLVIKDHDLLMIIKYADGEIDEENFLRPIVHNYTIPPRIKTFKVFKLDQFGPQWVHVPSLEDDQIVFLSRKNYMIISTDVVNINRKHQKKEDQITGNCIYFAFDYACTTSPQEGRDVGVFSLADESIKRHLPSVPRPWVTLSPIWFTPNPW